MTNQYFDKPIFWRSNFLTYSTRAIKHSDMQTGFHILKGSARGCSKSTFIFWIWIYGMKSKHNKSYFMVNVVLLLLVSCHWFWLTYVFFLIAVAHTNVNPNAADLISGLVPSRFITVSLQTRLKDSTQTKPAGKRKLKMRKHSEAEFKDLRCNRSNSHVTIQSKSTY